PSVVRIHSCPVFLSLLFAAALLSGFPRGFLGFLSAALPTASFFRARFLATIRGLRLLAALFPRSLCSSGLAALLRPRGHFLPASGRRFRSGLRRPAHL